MAENSIGAREAELRLDVADAWPVGMLADVSFHVVQDSLLLFGEFFHSERMFYETLFTVNTSVKLRYLAGNYPIKAAISSGLSRCKAWPADSITLILALGMHSPIR